MPDDETGVGGCHQQRVVDADASCRALPGNLPRHGGAHDQPQGPGKERTYAGAERDQGVGPGGVVGDIADALQQDLYPVGVRQCMGRQQGNADLGGKRQQARQSVAPGGQGDGRRCIGQEQGQQEGERGEQDHEYERVGVVTLYEGDKRPGQDLKKMHDCSLEFGVRNVGSE